MSGKPAPGTVLGRLDDLPDPGGRASDWNKGGAILIRRDGEVRAYVNSCPHAGLRLSLPDGRVMVHKDGYIVCPVHGASFKAGTGECIGGPAADTVLERIEVELSGGEIRAR